LAFATARTDRISLSFKGEIIRKIY
jgi:hypothetical protein